MAFLIRSERPSDIPAIFGLTRLAFANHKFGNHTEQFVVNALRAANALTFSLVAEDDGKIVGHVAFSPVTISDGSPGWYGLGPISVLPERQKQGIGSALIHAGLVELKAIGANGCALLGDPNYYGRFGFVNHPTLTLPGVPQVYFLILPLSGHTAQGGVSYHDAFSAQSGRPQSGRYGPV